jgi:hypothetical protein
MAQHLARGLSVHHRRLTRRKSRTWTERDRCVRAIILNRLSPRPHCGFARTETMPENAESFAMVPPGGSSHGQSRGLLYPSAPTVPSIVRCPTAQRGGHDAAGNAYPTDRACAALLTVLIDHVLATGEPPSDAALAARHGLPCPDRPIGGTDRRTARQDAAGDPGPLPVLTRPNRHRHHDRWTNAPCHVRPDALGVAPMLARTVAVAGPALAAARRLP